MSKVDSLIESWAKGRAGSVRESVDGTLDGFENFSLSTPTEKAEAPPATPLDAAHAVREAVLAKTGRRPKTDYWKPVAAKALGISRLFAKRWQAVLDAGVEAGLFTIDADSLKHPFIVPCEITEPEPEPEPVREVRVKAEPEPDIEPASGLPEGWKPPVVFKCGHMNWPHHGTDENDEKQVAAREAGHCCSAYAEAVATHKRLNPRGGTPSLSVQWRVKGLYEPVPKGMRRTIERTNGPGFPGLCCDPKTGLYIGGIGNNCRFHKGKARCEAHAPKERK